MFLPATAKDMLQNAEKSWQFHSIALYLLKQEILTGD
jgi:hypothetical protein